MTKPKITYRYVIKIKNEADLSGYVAAYSEKQARMIIIMKHSGKLRTLENYIIDLAEEKK